MRKDAPRMFVMAVHGAIVLGQPLPLKATAFGLRIVPVAEVLPDVCERPLHYSIKAFCSLADISRSTANRLIAQGLLKARKLGRRTVIPYESAMAYLTSLRPVVRDINPDDDTDSTMSIDREV
jgi:hypothetical protein